MPNVALVPGFTQTAASWAPAAEVIAESCDVLTVDVPVRDTFDKTAMAIGVRANRRVFAGYSMGGRLCLRLALDRPDLVEALVLVSATPGIVDPSARSERIAADEQRARDIETRGVAAFLDDWLAQPMFATVPADAPGRHERESLAPGYLAHCLRVLGTGTMTPMWDRLGELRMPVALVTGTQDPKFEAIALQMLERITTEVTHIRLDGGHALPLEQPGVLGGFIASFAAQYG